MWFGPPRIKNPCYTYALGRTCTFAIGYFYDKTKIFNEFVRVDYYLLLKYSRRYKIYLKRQDFKRVLDLNCK